MRVAELFELQLKQGPCFDAYDRRAYVESGSPEDALTRWPAFTPHAVENGFLSVFAVPLRLRDQVIGALNLFSSARGALGAADVRVAQAMADIATIGILQERAVGDARAVTSQLEHALQSRITIEQAKGIIAEHNDIGVDAAFALLRRYVRGHQLRLHDTAQRVIDGKFRLDQLTEVAPGT
jgi:GAF domain-containing protein